MLVGDCSDVQESGHVTELTVGAVNCSIGDPAVYMVVT